MAATPSTATLFATPSSATAPAGLAPTRTLRRATPMHSTTVRDAFLASGTPLPASHPLLASQASPSTPAPVLSRTTSLESTASNTSTASSASTAPTSDDDDVDLHIKVPAFRRQVSHKPSSASMAGVHEGRFSGTHFPPSAPLPTPPSVTSTNSAFKAQCEEEAWLLAELKDDH